MKKVSFSTEAAERIAKATLKIEKQKIHKARTPNNIINLPPLGFWAQITEVDDGYSPFRYEWKSLEPGSEDYEINEDWPSGTVSDGNYAISIDDDFTFAQVGDRVFLRPSISQPYFVFAGDIGFDRAVGLLAEDYTGGVGTFDVDNITTSRGRSPVSSASDIIEVYFPFANWGSAPNNSVCMIEWHRTSQQWFCYALDCEP